MLIRKSIAYCYPTSPFAKVLGVHKTGGWYVQQYSWREDGTWSRPYVAQGNDVFTSSTDPDLIALYLESDGEPCPSFLTHGDADALAAIDAASKVPA